MISISSGGGTGMSVEERLDVVFRAEPELTTLNLGTMNFGYFPMIEKYRGAWQHEWEEPYLESSRREPFISTFADMETMLAKAAETGTRFEFEAYDVGHLYHPRPSLRPRPGRAAGVPADDLRQPRRHRVPRSTTWCS